jgi:glycosyltransferase involved in cell wall biosynthesis
MQNHNPRVAVGLPVYNAEQYLAPAIDSILGQTYADFELIISDNASTDRTAEICASYADSDPRVRYFRNDRNLGAAPNFNRAFAVSSSEYFKWAVYDDLVAPHFLERCVEALDQRPDAALCYTRATIIDESGAPTVDYDPGPDTGSSCPHDRFGNLILRPEYALQCLGLIRSNVLRQTRLHGSYPSSDEVLLAELALRGPFAEIPERLYLYRRHAAQSTGEPRQRMRMRFFDTSMADRVTLPKWLYLFGCVEAVRRAPVSRAVRWRCAAQILRWMVVPPHARALGRDVLIALGQLVRRGWSMDSLATESAATGSSERQEKPRRRDGWNAADSR